MILTQQKLRQILNTNPQALQWYPLLEKYLPLYSIESERRIACFLGQLSHESGQFRRLKENLNYSVEGLLKVFPKYFPNRQIAEQYARQPQKIANRVYANRMGNRGEASGDGWRYAGRGLIMVTGQYNYNLFSLHCNRTLAETVEYLQTMEGALHSACWFWDRHKLNHLADGYQVTNISRIINGGTIHLQTRIAETNRILQIL
jgi:putative chitinase